MKNKTLKITTLAIVLLIMEACNNAPKGKAAKIDLSDSLNLTKLTINQGFSYSATHINLDKYDIQFKSDNPFNEYITSTYMLANKDQKWVLTKNTTVPKNPFITYGPINIDFTNFNQSSASEDTSAMKIYLANTNLFLMAGDVVIKKGNYPPPSALRQTPYVDILPYNVQKFELNQSGNDMVVKVEFTHSLLPKLMVESVIYDSIKNTYFANIKNDIISGTTSTITYTIPNYFNSTRKNIVIGNAAYNPNGILVGKNGCALNGVNKVF